MERKFNDQEIARRDKLKKLQELKSDPFCFERFERNFNSESFKKAYAKFSKDELHENTDEIRIAGRVMAVRQTFGVIRDFYGDVQFYINKKTMPIEEFNVFQNLLDLGDVIGIVGTPMKTNTDEITIRVKSFVILSKSLKPLPEKFHGLSDEETRARKRYLDLMVNRDSLETFVLRSKILRYIREYMDNKNFYEVETPVLHGVLGGAAARPFITHHNTLDCEYYLRIATELPLKKLIVGGFEKVYEIGRIFRNEGMDTTHNPEFTTIEVYEAYANLDDMMLLTESLIKYIAEKINKKTITYKGTTIDFSKPFERHSMIDLVKKYSGVDFNTIKTDVEANQIAKKHEIELENHQKTKGHVIAAFFEKYCEDKCLQPTFITDFPIEISPLAKKCKNDPTLTRRFELFICGKEYANSFSELNDSIDQLERFEAQVKERELGNSEANEVDMEYIDALEYGLAPTGGLGIGIDRLAMMFTGSESIRDVLLFPHMRNKNE